MTRTRSVLGVLVTISLLTMVVTSSALAHAYFVEGKEVTKNSPEGVTFEGSSSETSKIVDKKLLSVECKTGTIKGEFERRGESSGGFKFSSCKVFNKTGVEQPACTTEPAAKFVAHITVFQESTANLFEPTSSVTFMVLTISGASCELKGSYNINGKQQCVFGLSIANENVKHEVKCGPAGSELTLSSNPVEFTTTQTITVPTEKKWSAT